jgi:lipoyl-dependent peroxiredoxin
MATFSRKVTVDWSGPIMEGKGTAKAGTGAFTLPVTFPSRVGEPAGQTSPEELMAASHAACYAMALNATLGRKQASAARTLVTATVTADKTEAGIKLLSSKLTVTAEGLKGLEVAVCGRGARSGRQVSDFERAARNAADRCRGRGEVSFQFPALAIVWRRRLRRHTRKATEQ